MPTQDWKAEYVDLASARSVDADAVIVRALHDQYRSLDWKLFRGLRVVFDGHGSLDPEKIRNLGLTYVAVDVDHYGRARASDS